MSTVKDVKNSKVSDIQEEKDKREVIRRSKNARRDNFTLIDNNCLQSQTLSLTAIGLIAHLISLPHDWIVYTTQLSKRFNLGRDSIRKLIKELINNGYMRRYQERNKDGRLGRWVTEFADTPEFLNILPETENPAPVAPGHVTPAPVKSPLQINNNKKRTSYKKTISQQASGHISKTDYKQPSSLPELTPKVVFLLENVQKWAIAETLLRTWLKKYGVEYIIEKIEYTEAHSKTNPAGFLRKAVENNYQKHLADEPKVEKKPPVEPIWPSHEQNLTWYTSLSDENKQKCFNEAIRKHAHFEEMLKIEKVNFKGAVFLKTTWFKMMMQLVGRAK